MEINQIVCRAASAYPKALVLRYWDEGKQLPRVDEGTGDTLAEFITRELAGIHDETASDGEQIASAVLAMQRASDDLDRVAEALSSMAVERAA